MTFHRYPRRFYGFVGFAENAVQFAGDVAKHVGLPNGTFNKGRSVQKECPTRKIGKVCTGDMSDTFPFWREVLMSGGIAPASEERRDERNGRQFGILDKAGNKIFK